MDNETFKGGIDYILEKLEHIKEGQKKRRYQTFEIPDDKISVVTALRDGWHIWAAAYIDEKQENGFITIFQNIE
ncbi:hypothetical protein [Cerasicoccus arenae]|uniref:Uncharacterized protein n=1 Tax=Cerasicoccus arenae TaxID=424488 RepID=A0A8J3DFV6_9BACT|nr:hypothetical protein [Cerasicoccus arenae]MBK1858220.1 hypothetical protein [Cerasicoccus arenae]GHC01980.1 hypothetical protein GCM10007047_18070 [Cerasicoccus arenae]